MTHNVLIPLLTYLVCAVFCALVSLRSEDRLSARCIWALTLAVFFSVPPTVTGMSDFLDPEEDIHGHVETATLLFGLVAAGGWTNAFLHGIAPLLKEFAGNEYTASH